MDHRQPLDIQPVSRYNVDIMESKVWHTALPGNEFDYLALMGALKKYKRPRDRVTKLLHRKEIIRVKKGIYVLGPDLARGGISREVLGNLLYGPSYLSMEYALSWHQLIPERVETVTLVTLNKTKTFTTPLGYFTYRHAKPAYYRMGQLSQQLPDKRGFIIAGPEKALADMVYFARALDEPADLRNYLFSDLRIDREAFARMDVDFFRHLAFAAGRRSLRLLSELARESL